MPVSCMEVPGLARAQRGQLSPTKQAEQVWGSPGPSPGLQGDAVSRGSFPRNTLCELEICCSGIYGTSDKFMLFLECCSPTVHCRNHNKTIPKYDPFKIM